jgi:hypothetical protein
MELEPIYTIRTHSIVVTEEGLESILGYTNYALRDLRTKLDEYHSELAKQHGEGLRRIREEDTLTLQVRREIARAEAIARDIELLRDEMGIIYRWHFAQLAEVFRQTRLHLEADNLESLYTMRVVLHYLMQMLKGENPKFNEQHFLDYINGEAGGEHAATV